MMTVYLCLDCETEYSDVEEMLDHSDYNMHDYTALMNHTEEQIIRSRNERDRDLAA